MTPLVRRPTPELPPALGEILDFMRLIWALDHGLQRTSKRMRATIGVTGPQRLVIRIVARFPGLPAGHLARLLHIHPSTLTGILQRLERQGLVRRGPDPHDGRRALLWITEKGRRLDTAASGTVESAVEQVISREPATRVESARRLLTELAAVLNREG